MVERGFSCPSTAFVFRARYTSAKGIGVAAAPEYLANARLASAFGTLSFMPFMSSIDSIFLLDVVCLVPL